MFIAFKNSLGQFIDIILFIIQYALLPIFIYQFAVSMFGWFKRKEIPASKYPPIHKFAIIISAHNEALVIGNIVRNLKSLNYPESLYDIYVVADNCSDNTYQVAVQNGAIAYKRYDEYKKGKGHALEWMFGKISRMDKEYSAVCVLDADNLVSTNFLLEMNKRLCQGQEVIQGYLDSKNPNDSIISGSHAITYWIANRIYQLPRHYLGLSCTILGTGFVISTKILNEVGWNSTCLTEDLEFTIKLVLKGKKVYWSHEALIYDEKPLTFKQSCMQRKRWMQGQSDCAVRYSKELLVKSIVHRDMLSFDCLLYICQPLLILINGVSLLLSLFKFLLLTNFRYFSLHNILLPVIIILASGYLFGIVLFAERKATWKIIVCFLLHPFYNLTWIPIIILGFIDRNKKEWVHTLHTRALEISEIEGM